MVMYSPGGSEKHFDGVAGQRSADDPAQKSVLPVPHPINTSVNTMGVPQGQLIAWLNTTLVTPPDASAVEKHSLTVANTALVFLLTIFA